VGADLLRDRIRDHDGAGGMARAAVRAQAAVHRVAGGLHRHIDDVWSGAVAGADRRLPGIARRLRRRNRAIVAGGDAGYLSNRAARADDGDLRHRHNGRANHGANARRLSHRHVQLALGVLRQPAIRHYRDHGASFAHAGDAATERNAVRLDRLLRAGNRHQLSAVDAGPRANGGLVQRARDYRGSSAGGPWLLPVRRAHVHSGGAVSAAAIVQGPQLHHRLRDDVLRRHRADCEFGANRSLPAKSGGLPGFHGGTDDGAARHRHHDLDADRRPHQRQIRGPAQADGVRADRSRADDAQHDDLAPRHAARRDHRDAGVPGILDGVRVQPE
jgi:hypothetical protein